MCGKIMGSNMSFLEFIIGIKKRELFQDDLT